MFMNGQLKEALDLKKYFKEIFSVVIFGMPNNQTFNQAKYSTDRMFDSMIDQAKIPNRY